MYQAELGAAEIYPSFRKKVAYLQCPKNKHGRNFENIASKTNQRWVINYDKPLIHFGTDILKIVAVSVFFNTS